MSRQLAQTIVRLAREFVTFGPGVASVYMAKYLGKSTLKVALRGAGTVTIRPMDTDFETLGQIFRDGGYDLMGAPQELRLEQHYRTLLEAGRIPVIVDCGANIGGAALWFASKFPRAKIIALEPDPDTAALCRTNLASNPNITFVEGAIGGKSGFVSIQRQGGAASSRTKRSEMGEDGPTRVLTIGEVLASAGANAELLIVKIDIEGFEADLFASGTEWVDQAAAIYVEPHDWMFPGQKTSQPLQRAVLGRNFEMLVRREYLVFIKDGMHDPRENSLRS